MRYCRNCLQPDTRPGIVLAPDGICNACHNSRIKDDGIDWSAREKAFLRVVDAAKKRSSGYDCIVPVSGGKDSTWQIITCLEYGLNPLAVTWKTPARSEIGQKNLDNLVSLGVDHIDYQVSPAVERVFLKKSFIKYGTVALPMHMALFNIPLTIAAKFDIPLVIWGENSAFEYGSKNEEAQGFLLDEAWLKTHGVTHGTTAEDWVSDDLSRKQLTPYFGPGDKEMQDKGIRAIFLGYYFPWDPEESLRVSQEHGFRVREEGPKTGYWDYADIDDEFIAIHHYIKWYKFGMTRAFDNLSVEIRNGRMTRNEAIGILKNLGEQRPDADIAKFCAFTGINEQEFNEILETFRNHDIWKKVDGTWKMEDFLIPDWSWN